MAKVIKTGVLYRSAEFERSGINDEARTVPLTFSSEAPLPVEMEDGYRCFEILDHSPDSMNLARINSGGPLLVDHNRKDQVGVVVPGSAGIRADKKGYAVVRFGKSARAQEIFQDVKDGIRSLVSVGYHVSKYTTEKVQQGMETLRAVKWTPMEISLVSIPLDTDVGVGRADNNQTFETRIESMETVIAPVAPPVAPAPAPTPGLEFGRDNSNAEYTRQTEIDAIADRLDGKVPGVREMALAARKARTSVEAFRAQVMDAMPTVQPVRQSQPLEVKPKDWSRYSISRAICAQLPGAKFDGLEREVNDEIALRQGQKSQGFWLPQEALSQRVNVAATGTLGGMIVQTSNLGDQFIELLRNRAQVMALGARSLTLDNPVTIPRQNGAGTANWNNGETVVATVSTSNFTQLTLTPKVLTAWQEYSKQLLATNNPSIDSLLQDDIVKIIGLAIDLACLHGSGASGQPTGIAGTTGIGSVAMATDGLALGNTTAYPALVSLETLVATANADAGALAYLMRPGHRGALKTAARFANSDTPVWDSRIPASPVNGYRAEVTAQIATNLTTGTATTITSPIFFGNWNEVLIGNFAGGATDMVVDPYTLATNGVVRLIAHRWLDIGVRHPASFAILGGLLTT